MDIRTVIDLTASQGDPPVKRRKLHKPPREPLQREEFVCVPKPQSPTRNDIRDADVDLCSTQGIQLALADPSEKQLQGSFHCCICCDDHLLPPEERFTVTVCGHSFCREGAQAMVLSAVRSNDLPLLCPVCKAGADPPCARCSLLKVAAGGGPAVQWCCRLDSDVVRLLDGNQMEEYLRKSLQGAVSAYISPGDGDIAVLVAQRQIAQETFDVVQAAAAKDKSLVNCPQPGCEGLAAAGGVDDSPRLVCNICSHNWCKDCKVAWHDGMHCDEHHRQKGESEADKNFEAYRKKIRTRDCPRCGAWQQKNGGCAFVVCAVCHQESCWDCGEATVAHQHQPASTCASVAHWGHIGMQRAQGRRLGGRGPVGDRGPAQGPLQQEAPAPMPANAATFIGRRAAQAALLQGAPGPMPAHAATYHGRRAAQAALLQGTFAPMPAHAEPLFGRGTAQAALLQVPPVPVPAYAAHLFGRGAAQTALPQGTPTLMPAHAAPLFGRGAAQTALPQGGPALMPGHAVPLFGAAAALDAGSPPPLPMPAWMFDDPWLQPFHLGLPMLQPQQQAPAGQMPGTLFPQANVPARTAQHGQSVGRPRR